MNPDSTEKVDEKVVDSMDFDKKKKLNKNIDQSCPVSDSNAEGAASLKRMSGEPAEDEINFDTISKSMEGEEPVNKSPKCTQEDKLNNSELQQPLPSAAGGPQQHSDSFYHIKWINFDGKQTAIVTQNENGPCPLLALFNVLLLSHKVQLPMALTVISSSKMLDHIGEVMWSGIPTNLSETERSNYDQNVADAINIFPKLQTGLDVNVNFTSVQAFEYTPELTVFDLLRIPIYHGWVIDPQDAPTATALGGRSYNQLVEKIINSKSSTSDEVLREGMLAEEFLNNTASQLTYYGISLLLETITAGSLAVLFRNNHFSAIHRRKDELFTLVTDCGFLREAKVVWETLSSVGGDSHFVDSDFHTAPLKSDTQCIETCPTNLDSAEQIDYDYQVALSLQQDQVPGSSDVTHEPEQLSSEQLEDASYQLAVQLQKEEEERANQQRTHDQPTNSAGSPPTTQTTQPRQHRPHTAPSSSQKDPNCSLL